MPHYRKLEIGDKTYEYNVGRTATHVKGVGTFENSIIGQYEEADPLGKVAITPKVVIKAINAKLAGEVLA